jgi:hypothetical protein
MSDVAVLRSRDGSEVYLISSGAKYIPRGWQGDANTFGYVFSGSRDFFDRLGYDEQMDKRGGCIIHDQYVMLGLKTHLRGMTGSWMRDHRGHKHAGPNTP